MTVHVRVPGPLTEYASGQGALTLDVAGATVADALRALWTVHPRLRDRILDEQGNVRPHVNVFVGRESIRYTGGLETPLPAGATLSVIPAVSGG
ncbi:MAG TPA: ubiquitin-like small modifier protein 1 [Vicinamibacteria bacterium]|nr:ubiquitin-like small modifier protein 1 [Vicinamibacteria bacterium]